MIHAWRQRNSPASWTQSKQQGWERHLLFATATSPTTHHDINTELLTARASGQRHSLGEHRSGSAELVAHAALTPDYFSTTKPVWTWLEGSRTSCVGGDDSASISVFSRTRTRATEIWIARGAPEPIWRRRVVASADPVVGATRDPRWPSRSAVRVYQSNPQKLQIRGENGRNRMDSSSSFILP
jgi:hypothetical protein